MTAPIPTWWPLVAQVTTCLCANLATTIAGPPGRCCALPGGAVVIDDCCNGTAWVRLERISAATTSGTTARQGPLSPSPTSWGGQPCSDQQAQIVLGIGVMRCASTIDEDNNPPSCSTLEDETQVMLSDSDALYRTALCCLDSDALGVYTTEVISYTPQGPTGGCVGGELLVGYVVDICVCEP